MTTFDRRNLKKGKSEKELIEQRFHATRESENKKTLEREKTKKHTYDQEESKTSQFRTGTNLEKVNSGKSGKERFGKGHV